ncbi:MAG: hypothetical protein GF350_16365 [Chitinivibrionales bacterium]|nr:hypothetical protein [Chitinivibrionales bacterium]
MMKRLMGIFAFAAVCTGIHAADSTCYLRIDACNLGNLEGKTIEVPVEITEISRDVKACLPEVGFQGSFQDTASIFFIIDESGSMAQNDPNGSRYEVTKQFLDEMYSSYPYIRVGAAVFSDRLAWHINDDPVFFSKIGDYEYSDAYIPLMPLDSTLGNDSTAAQNIKKWLNTYTDRYGVVRLDTKTSEDKERSGGSTNGTDISLGFEAAKDAFKNSPTDKRRQFVVFISDGDARDVNTERLDSLYNYVAGEGVPTTYTFYICENCTEAPARLVNMTENIQTNNYSTTNEKSSISAITDPDSDLLSRMQSIVVEEEILADVTPSTGTLSGQSAAATTDTNFVFPSALPLSTSDLEVSVSLTWDYSYSQTGAPDNGDTTISATFTVRQSSSVSLQNFDPASGLLYECIKLSPVQPAYFDADADGYIDEIKVYLDEAVATAEIESLQNRITSSDLPAHRYLSVDTITSMNNGFIIEVTQDKTKATINTGIDPGKDTLHIDEYLIKPSYDNFVPGGTYAIADSMAPVLVGATYKPYSLSDNGNRLDVVFSESIPAVTNTEPFKFLQDDDIGYLMVVEEVLESSGANHSFRISEVKPEFGTVVIYAKNGDSTWIYSGRVGDGQNTQEALQSRKTELVVINPEFKFELAAIKLSPDKKSEELTFGNWGPHDEGAMVILKSLKAGAEARSVSVDIYDPIGNHLARGEYDAQVQEQGDNINIEIRQGENINLGQTEFASWYFIKWNGRNKNNRAVASGTYMMYVEAVDKNDSKTTQKIKIGVKR